MEPPLNSMEAAKFIDICVDLLLEKARTKEIKGYKRGRKWYFFTEDLIDWIKGEDCICQKQKHLLKSTNDKAIGNTHSPHQMGSAYAELLKLNQKPKRVN